MALKGAGPPLPVTIATFTLRPCSQQEILEEVVRELHKVKEEIIDGEWQGDPHPDPRHGAAPSQAHTKGPWGGLGCLCPGLQAGVRRAQPVRPSWAERLRVCIEGFCSSSPQPTPASQFSGWAD